MTYKPSRYLNQVWIFFGAVSPEVRARLDVLGGGVTDPGAVEAEGDALA